MSDAFPFVRLMMAELEVTRVMQMVNVSRYTWSGIGKAPWVRVALKRMVGRADRLPIDWEQLVQRLRSAGWTGELPRSLRRYDPPPYTGLLTSYPQLWNPEPSRGVLES